MANLLLTLLAALAFGWLMLRLRVPGGMMVGAIIGVVLLNVLTGLAAMPYSAKFTAQAVAGAFIGCSVQKDDLKRIPRLARPIALLMGCMLALNLAAGFSIWLCSPLDLLTSLMSAVPGGMSDTPIIAADMGADAGKVAVLQFIRLAAGVGIFPSVINAYDRRCRQREAPAGPGIPAGGGATRAPSASKGAAAFAATMAVALSGGLVGRASGLPAAVLVFAMAAVIAFNLTTGRAYLPIWARRLAQTLAGAYVGCSMGLDDLLELPHLLLPALIVLAGYAVNCFVTGGLLRRLFGLERKEAMLAATPAGASDMALISADIGVQSTDLVVLQVFRMVLVISIFPQIIRLVAGFFAPGA